MIIIKSFLFNPILLIFIIKFKKKLKKDFKKKKIKMKVFMKKKLIIINNCIKLNESIKL